MPLISVIVSNFNGARFLPRLLETLLAQRAVTTEIIVVDRHSTDASAAILAGFPAVKVISEPPETGLVAGYHAGSQVAAGELYFFCNEDMWFDPDCLRLLASHLDLDRRIGSADPWQWTYDGAEWIHGGTQFRPTCWAINSPHPRFAADFAVPLPAGALVPFPCAGALLIHREVYRELGGWDGSFFLDHEDIDLFLRAWQRGWKTVQVPGAKVYHAVNASNAQTLTRLNISVSRRRYVSQRANLTAIALKYFSWWAIPAALLAWPAVLLNNVAKGRWRFVLGDFAALRELARRWPAIWNFRRAHSAYIHYRPGQRFFSAPEHRLAALNPPPADAGGELPVPVCPRQANPA
jgi:GT2 family glycosyltransferase